jgi:hypothetical protein
MSADDKVVSIFARDNTPGAVAALLRKLADEAERGEIKAVGIGVVRIGGNFSTHIEYDTPTTTFELMAVNRVLEERLVHHMCSSNGFYDQWRND